MSGEPEERSYVGQPAENSIRRELAELIVRRTATQGHDLNTADVDRFVATLRALHPPPATLLDAGCGTGVLTDLAARLGYAATGVDLDPLVMRHMDTALVVGSIGDLPFEDRSFDVVVVNEVLEHLPVDVYLAARSEIGRVSRSQIVITVPNEESLESASTRCPACAATYSIHGHVRRFAKHEMARLVPGFALTALGEVGPFKIRHRSLEWVVRRRLLGRWPAQPGAKCPQCGWQQSGNRTTSATESRIGRAVRLVAGMPWRRWWLIASYERLSDS